MTNSEYEFAWLVYLASSVTAFLCLCWLVSHIPWRVVRLLLLFPVVALALLPMEHPANPAIQVPAIAAAVVGTIADGQVAAIPAYVRLSLALLVALFLALLAAFLWKRLSRHFGK